MTRRARKGSQPLCPVPVYRHWHVSDGGGGWYVVDPFGHRDGPYTEQDADYLCAERRKLYPIEGCTCEKQGVVIDAKARNGNRLGPASP